MADTQADKQIDTQASANEEADFTLIIKRIFNAPRERVWQAWTDKAHLTQWLSPKGFYVHNYEGEIAEGEPYQECMISPDGQKSVFFGEYLEMVEPEKLVFSHTWKNDVCGIPDIRTICTVILQELAGGHTQMTFTQSGLSSIASRDSHNGGWSECFDKLHEWL